MASTNMLVLLERKEVLAKEPKGCYWKIQIVCKDKECYYNNSCPNERIKCYFIEKYECINIRESE
jgi:hypothetical protein